MLELIGVSICALIVCCIPFRSVSTIFFVSVDSFNMGKLSHAILLIVIASSKGNGMITIRVYISRS